MERPNLLRRSVLVAVALLLLCSGAQSVVLSAGDRLPLSLSLTLWLLVWPGWMVVTHLPVPELPFSFHAIETLLHVLVVATSVAFWCLVVLIPGLVIDRFRRRRTAL